MQVIESEVEMTSSAANKALKKLADQKKHIIEIEEKSSQYVEIENSEVVIPSYNYEETQNTIDNIDNTVVAIKHAVNKFNIETKLPCGLTIDMALIKMAQLNIKKDRLDRMKSYIPKSVTSMYGGGDKTAYLVLNYDVSDVEEEYDNVINEIYKLQTEIDYANSVNKFTVKIPE